MGLSTSDWSELPKSDAVLAAATQFLVDGGEFQAATLLLSCDADGYEEGSEQDDFGSWVAGVRLRVACPRFAYDALTDSNSALTRSVERSIGAFIERYSPFWGVKAHPKVGEYSPKWRDDMLSLIRGGNVHNQGITKPGENAITVLGLRYRSQSEVKIADELDRQGLLFLPNCMGRLTGTDGRRVNREADFLVCAKSNRWGILEVDGEPFHPPSRTVQDHERDRLFRTYGIRVVEHYDAPRCYKDSEGVVRNFLLVMSRAYGS